MNNSQHSDLSTFFQKIIKNNSATTLVLIRLGAGASLIGGNILIARYYRRLGKPSWPGLKPFALPLKDFNAREWLILFALTCKPASAFSGPLLLQMKGSHDAFVYSWHHA